jgi:hypothetical protein
MGTEWVIPVLGLPLLGCVLLLVVVAIRGSRMAAGHERFLGLGRARIATGYLGALAGTLIVAIWFMQSQLRWGLHSGNYPKDATAVYATELLLFYFISLGVAVVVLTTVLGLPLLAGLRLLRLASVAGLGLVSITVAGFVSWLSHGPLLGLAGICALVAIGFALGARLPSLRSPPMRANTSLKRTREG